MICDWVIRLMQPSSPPIHSTIGSANSIGSNTANNGYPCTREGDYGVTSNMIDGIVRGDNGSVNDPFLVIWANGNERSGGSPRGRCGGGYVTTAPPSCAKNPIHVGALYSDGNAITTFTSWGPCDDGRLRPVISGSGCETGLVTGESGTFSATSASNSAYGLSCGTSMSSPAVTGIATLFIQDWRAQGHGGASDRPLPALVKAMMVQTADDLGVAGPDYMTGYGNVNGEDLINLLRDGDLTTVTGISAAVGWDENTSTNSDVDTYDADVAEGTGYLKATLAWDDAAAAAFAANALVNDLDLEIVSPGGAVTHLPFILDPANPHLAATTGVNTRDNQEQVLVKNPEAGTWTIRVLGTSVPSGPQTYGIAWEAVPADSGACDERVHTRDFEAGTDGWTMTGEAARTAAPGSGHGSFSMRLGGMANLSGRAHLTFDVPADGVHTNLGYWWRMTTDEGGFGSGFDNFLVEVQDLANNQLAVFDIRSDAWAEDEWMKGENIDLSPWAGQQVQVVFRATNNTQRPTTFWFDDVTLSSCGSPDMTHWVGFETGDLSGWTSTVP